MYKKGYTTYKHTKYVTAWYENEHWPNECSWPVAKYDKGESFTKSASFSTGVGASDGFISAQLGFNVTASSTVTASQGYHYKIPYMKKGRVRCISYFKRYKYNLKTHYVQSISGVCHDEWDEWAYNKTADSPLYNSTFGVQLVSM